MDPLVEAIGPPVEVHMQMRHCALVVCICVLSVGHSSCIPLAIAIIALDIVANLEDGRHAPQQRNYLVLLLT